MLSSRTWLVPLAGMALAAAARSQTTTTIVETGTVLPGFGTVLAVNGIAVDDTGHAFARAWTSNPNPNFGDTVVDETGAVVLYATMALGAPAGAMILNFQGGNFVRRGDGVPAFGFDLIGGTGGGAGIYYGMPPTLAIECPSVSTAPQLTPGTQFRYLLYPKINASGSLLFYSYLDDPSIPGTNDSQGLFLVDPATGTQNAIVKSGQILPGQTWGMSTFNMNRHQIALSDSGHVFFSGTTFDNPNVNKVFYRDTTKIAQMSDMSPFGSTFVSFGSVATNASDDFAYICHLNDIWGLDGIVRNGQPFAQVGDTFPSILPYKIDNFGTPLFLANDGHMAWGGSWLKPNGTSGMGIFLDYTAVVVTGSTLVHGVAVTNLTLVDGSFSLSNNGRYLAFQATLQSGVTGAYLMDLWQ